MRKKLEKIVSKIALATTLSIVGTTAIPAVTTFASIEQDGLKNQCIYPEGDYIIVKENASYYALVQCVWIEFRNYTPDYGCIGYDAPCSEGTKTFPDGTIITVEKQNEGYQITYKLKKSNLEGYNNVRAVFETESTGGGSPYGSFTDDNGGWGYFIK